MKAGRRLGAYSQATRVLRLLGYLSTTSYGVPLALLAELLQVSQRQVRRDFVAINAAGYVVETAGDGVRSVYRLAKGNTPAFVSRRRAHAANGGMPKAADQSRVRR
jgi:predicted DNA-binding transcriptional regulator YafY